MDWLKDPLVTPVAGIVASVVVGYVFYRLSQRLKRPCWAIRSNNLFRGSSATIPNLEIKYAGQPVETLTVSKLIFWNAGSDTIDGSDIAEGDRLRIVSTTNARILDVKMVKSNSLPSRFLISTKPDMSEAYSEFDFMDRGSGVHLQIIHTGTSSVIGTIKGAVALRLKRADAFKSLTQLIRECLTALLICFVFFAFGLFMIYKEGGISFGATYTTLLGGSGLIFFCWLIAGHHGPGGLDVQE